MDRERRLNSRRSPVTVLAYALMVVGLVLGLGCQAGPGPWSASSLPGGIVAAPAPPAIELGDASSPGATPTTVPSQAPTTPANRAAPAAFFASQPSKQLNPVAPFAPIIPTATDSADTGAVVRGQSPAGGGSPYVGSPTYSAPRAGGNPSYATPPASGWTGPVGTAAPVVSNYQPAAGAPPGVASDPNQLPAPPGWDNIPVPPSLQTPAPNYADLNAIVQETQTGRFQFGVGVNSDAGVTGQIVIDERNFDATRIPNSWDEVVNGTAFRGAGQGFRIEAMPGNQVHRYLVSFTEPYLFGFSPVSLNLSAFYFTRNYFDWNEQRLGGRAALGYRLSPDLSVSAALRAEDVDVSNPRVPGVAPLAAVVGSNDLFTGRFTLTHDTRDIPFFPTEGHYLELSYEQAFGEFSYPRGEIDYRKYFLVRERPDGSGRHTLALSSRLGVSGTDTPLFENYFAGGFSTIRGFAFRGASPIDNTVTVGGPFRFLASAEYFFPLTADDMIKGVLFCDAGTVEQDLHVNWDNFRVAPGFGLRLNIPAMGPAPLALDFAFPVAKASTDNTQVFSFFFGFGR